MSEVREQTIFSLGITYCVKVPLAFAKLV